ncbi:MAG TPA: hypothetical protein VI790_03895 [Candidatus Nanoarchaeia archaeon]|nr:hypothetical protein [Candidatus Nanoarchaeia archaeon]
MEKLETTLNKQKIKTKAKGALAAGLTGASTALLSDYLIAKEFESKDGIIASSCGQLSDYGYESSWMNFAPQSMLDFITTGNIILTYIEYQKAKMTNQSTWRKKVWMGIHATVALGSKIYSWMSGENVGPLQCGGGNTDYTSDRISFEKGNIVSLGALLFETASMFKTCCKDIKKKY